MTPAIAPDPDIVVLTGAGISAESGIATFRDEGGLWARHRIEDVATPEAFARDPDTVLAFYDARRAQVVDAKPNAAHAALSALQAKLGTRLLLVTQNVDSLHEAAGHKPVVHMHGQLDQALCPACDHRWPAPATIPVAHPCPACGTPGARPDIVWFGEMPYHMEAVLPAIEACTVFAAIGTSGQVYPAAGFVEIAANHGAETWEITLEPSGNPWFDHAVLGPATKSIPDWCAQMAVRFAPT
ncbi:MAG: NAD-dependent deacylase [Pseudomonadota bacterium]